jgi:hypothetical protein
MFVFAQGEDNVECLSHRQIAVCVFREYDIGLTEGPHFPGTENLLRTVCRTFQRTPPIRSKDS